MGKITIKKFLKRRDMQTFNIGVQGMQVTAALIHGLLHDYLSKMRYDGNIVVEEAAQPLRAIDGRKGDGLY